jgi:hypothetical protein
MTESKSTRRRRSSSKPGSTASPSESKRGPSEPARRERWALVSAATTIVGLAMVGSGASEVGAWVTLGGLIGLMAAVHTYGRLGAES